MYPSIEKANIFVLSGLILYPAISSIFLTYWINTDFFLLLFLNFILQKIVHIIKYIFTGLNLQNST